MKKLFVTLTICALCFGLDGQNKDKKSSEDKKKSETKKDDKKMGILNNDKPKNFIDRYYMMRDSYKDMPDAYGPFAASDYDMEKFIERYHSMKDGYPTLTTYAAQFAASKNDAKEFE